jgi:vitamin B12 transporter
MNAVLRHFWLVVLPTAVAGQTPRDTVELNPVVVTATRIPTRARDVPIAVTVLSGVQLEERGIRTVADALRSVPGVSVVTTDAYGSLTSLFLRGGQSDYVKVLIDGVPQNAAGGFYDFANLTTDNVERIEIVRGPASVLYGSDAVTGVVQIFTRDGRGAPRGSVAVSGGTYGNAAVETSVAAGDGLAGYAVSASRFTSDGVYPLNNHYRNEVVSGRLRVRPDARTEAALSFRYGDALYHFPTNDTGAVVSNNQHQLTRGPAVGLDLGHVFSARVDGGLTATWHRDNYQYAIAPNGPTDSTTFPFSSSDWATRTGLDARLNAKLPQQGVITLGVALEREALNGTSLATAQSRNDGAVYLQVVTLARRATSLTLGARLEDNERFGSYATYRTGVAVRLAAGTRAVASIGTGFKEPSFYETFATPFARGNPNVKPEHSFSWEAGLEYVAPGHAAAVRGTYFHQRFRDLIQYSFAPLGPDSVNYANVADATAQGLELGVQGALGLGVSLDATYTYLDPRDATTNLRLLRRPSHTGSLGLSYSAGGRGTVSLGAVFTGDRDDLDYRNVPEPRVTLPPHTRVDASGTYELARPHGTWPGVALMARLENLLDASYQDIKNFPARRRSLLFGGRMRFGT